MRTFAALLALTFTAIAEEKKDTPRVTGIAPMEVSPGAQVTLKFRGLKLDTATEIRFPAQPALKAVIKDKKGADVPNGLDAKDVGDKQFEAVLTLPADLALGPLAVEVVTPAGTSEKRELRVVEAASLVEEKEPNNGFREAQLIEPGKIVRGKIEGEKDVDVFAFTAHAKQKFTIEVFAARGTSLLDATLTLYDEHARVLQVCDDAETRDPVIHFEAPADGKFLLAIQDSGDRGGAWHSYELTLKEEK